MSRCRVDGVGFWRWLRILGLAAAALAPARPAGAAYVEIVVEQGLYASGQIEASLAQYLTDVRGQGYTPILTTTFSAATPAAELRSHLAQTWRTQGLAGAVFVGNLPAQFFANPADSSWHPCDLFFGDLDGTWAATSGTQINSHTAGAGDVGPEIWLGRIDASRIVGLHAGRTEAGLLNAYFARNHAYRAGALRVPQDGLLYLNAPWITVRELWAGPMRWVTPGTLTVVWNDPATPVTETTAADYKSRLAAGAFENVLLACHSNPTLHQFDSGYVYSSDLAGVDPQALFYTLYACESARFTSSGCMASEYVFGEGIGLLATGSTKVGGMAGFYEYYQYLAAGKTFGQTMLDWWNNVIDPYGHWDQELISAYGMATLGDPLLRMQAFVPEPGMGVMVLVGVGWGLGRRGRRGR